MADNNGLSGNDTNADHVRCFQGFLCSALQGWTPGSPAARGMEAVTSMMGLDARTFSSMLVSLAEPPTVAK